MNNCAYVARRETINFHIFKHLVSLHYIAGFWIYANNS